ncbi:MAG: ribose 5-phosphate isomerase B [Anaerolineaceae bacterium]|nr:ribose 5-phosphate isomerase B [Anaerolineaceae bacterium]
MKIAVACDHGGYSLKSTVIEAIKNAGHEVIDFGTDSPNRVDFPDFTKKAGRAIQEGTAERAILLCGSGIGVNIAANKMKGVYASVCHTTFAARQGVEHDNMNALCLGSRVIGEEVAKELVVAFLNANFFGVGNYKIRVEKIKIMENE